MSASDTVDVSGAGDLFYVWLALIVVVIAAFIVRAVRLTNASIAMASRQVNVTHPDAAAALVDEIRGRDLRCPQCRGETFALLGTGNRYQCESCDCTFEGPVHLPGASPQGEPLHPS